MTPDDVRSEREILTGGSIDVGRLVLFKARPCSGESDAEIVTEAWDFEAVNTRYARYRALLKQRPNVRLCNKCAAEILHKWAAEERAAWQDAVTRDPLLPRVLLPNDYLGCDAWQERVAAVQQLSEQLKTFRI